MSQQHNQSNTNTKTSHSTANGGDVRIRTSNGEVYIPATQRPDGTWRKARKVREGHIPQDEQPRFECKAQSEFKQTSKTSGNSVNYPVGWSPVDMVKEQKKKIINKNNNLSSTTSSNKPTIAVDNPNAPITPKDFIQKQINKFQKKIEEIDKLKEKIESGQLKNPEKNQLEKISKRKEIEEEIESLIEKLNKM